MNQQPLAAERAVDVPRTNKSKGNFSETPGGLGSDRRMWFIEVNQQQS
jgi:hypothetical protein